MQPGGEKDVDTHPRPPDIPNLLTQCLALIRSHRPDIPAAHSRLYWSLGRLIVTAEKSNPWPYHLIAHLADELRRAVDTPLDITPESLTAAIDFFTRYPAIPSEDHALACLLSWEQNRLIIDHIHRPDDRLWYLRHAVRHPLTFTALADLIRNQAHRAVGFIPTTFAAANIFPVDCDLNLFQPNYDFSFIPADRATSETDIEAALLTHIDRTLATLGPGFTFVARQHHIALPDRRFRIDLLLYHIPRQRHIIVELKHTDFQPEHLGKLATYCVLFDHHQRTPPDRPTLGLLLCHHCNRPLAHAALTTTRRPLAIATYNLQ